MRRSVATLVDIALRSLTDSYNDPTTANQAVDRIYDCLRLLVARDLGTGIDNDEVGELRLTVPNLEWEDYVEIAFGALVREEVNTPQVLDHIDEALRDLRTIASASGSRFLPNAADASSGPVRPSRHDAHLGGRKVDEPTGGAGRGRANAVNRCSGASFQVAGLPIEDAVEQLEFGLPTRMRARIGRFETEYARPAKRRNRRAERVWAILDNMRWSSGGRV